MILSIESSCDDSSIAITDIKTKKILFHKKISQEKEHSIYGGVVPELAARLHAQALPNILKQCKEYFPKLKAIAITTHPGLSVTLMEGLTMAKALSITLNIPLISVNHLKGHIYSLFLEQEEQLPCLVLLVSGGHTQLIDVKSLDNMKIIATTMDDSFGESFDKVAKMLGLGYPGGPIVQEYSQKGDSSAYDFPVPLRQSPKIAFSYSGLKNAVRMAIEKVEVLDEQTKANICASFQKSAVAHIMQKTKKYFATNQVKRFAIVGGASANIELREQIEQLCSKNDCELLLAPLQYCSDNAAMIGRIALEQYKNEDFTSIENIDVQTRVKGY